MLFVLSGCYREDTELPFIGYVYFPTELGKYVEYRVDSVWQDDPAGAIANVEAHYFLQELNESAFIDEEGRPAIRVERYAKYSPFGEWNMKDVWYKTRTAKVAEQNEENVVFIKQNFPVREGKTWDGNAKNTLLSLQEMYNQTTVPAVWDYQYKDVNQPYTINGFTFDSTVTVVQIDRPALAGLDVYAKEVYAKNVGLIHKQMRMYNIQGADSVGFYYEQVITDFGE